MHPIPLVSIPIYIKSLELSFSNLHFMVRTGPMHSMVFARVWVYSSLISHSFRFAGPFLRRSRDLYYFFHDPHFLSVLQ